MSGAESFIWVFRSLFVVCGRKMLCGCRRSYTFRMCVEFYACVLLISSHLTVDSLTIYYCTMYNTKGSNNAINGTRFRRRHIGSAWNLWERVLSNLIKGTSRMWFWSVKSSCFVIYDLCTYLPEEFWIELLKKKKTRFIMIWKRKIKVFMFHFHGTKIYCVRNWGSVEWWYDEEYWYEKWNWATRCHRIVSLYT